MRRTAASEDVFFSLPGSLPLEEKPDVMYQRISEFLHILGYQRGAPQQLSGKRAVVLEERDARKLLRCRCSFDIEFQQGLSLGRMHLLPRFAPT